MPKKLLVSAVLVALTILFLFGDLNVQRSEAAVTTKSCDFGSLVAGGQCRGYLTSTAKTTWTVPSDWNNSNNTIEVIGGGGGGQVSSGSAWSSTGGGGGGYSKVSNVTISGSITYQVGQGGASNTSGTDTYFNRGASATTTCSTQEPQTVCAKAGTSGGSNANGIANNQGGLGGAAASGIGATKFSGGNGGIPGGFNGGTGQGGGGAGGPHGDGAVGGNNANQDWGGGGGGGSGGGTAGANATSVNGAAGGNNFAGTGSGAGDTGTGAGGNGSNGGGGGGGYRGLNDPGGAGGNGTEWDASHGSGGGGGGDGIANGGNANGGTGGLYGGGGGGSWAGSTAGAPGIIVITYTPRQPVPAPGKQNVTLNPPNLNQGLVLHLTFDGKDMLRNVKDTSGNGNTGDLIAAATSSQQTPGIFGQGLKLNGTSQYVSTTKNAGFTNTTPFSASIWFKKSTASGGLELLLTTGINSSPFDGIWLGLGDGASTCDTTAFEFIITSSAGTTERICSATDYTTTQWYLLTVTYDGSQTIAGMKMYLNGTQITTTGPSDTGFGAFTDRPWYIGVVPDPASGFFGGIIDDARVYNRVLSAAEITQLYIQGIGTRQDVTLNPPNLNKNLVDHWTFDGKDMIKNVKDISGGNNGDLIAAATSSQQILGQIGQALSFDGSTQYVDTSNISAADNQSNFTVSAWFKMNASQTGHCFDTIASKIGSGGIGSGKGWTVYVADNNIACGSNAGKVYGQIAQDGSNYIQESSAPAVKIGTWHHVVMVVQGGGAGTLKVYVDNGPPNSGSLTGTVSSFNTTDNVRIGNDYDSALFNGSIDDVRIYNRVLSPAEITQLYKLGR